VKPELDVVSNEPLSLENAEGPLRPAWYKCLLPATDLDASCVGHVSAPSGRFMGSPAHVGFDVTWYDHATTSHPTPAGIAFWTLNERGEIEPETYGSDDVLKRSAHQTWPEMTLKDLPPRTTTAPATQPATQAVTP
jgi:hypothetical protein